MFQKFNEYLNGRKKLVEKPKVKEIADDLECKPNKPPKEKRGIKGGKQAQIKEYLDGNGKLITRPPTEIIPKGPAPSSVPGANSTKGIVAPKAPGKPAPYAAPAAGSRVSKGESGLGDKGDFGYSPDIKGGKSPFIPGGKTEKNGYETKTESFLTKTRNMSISDFAKFMMSEQGCGDANAPMLIRDLVTLGESNDRVITALVYEMKRHGLLPKMIAALEAVGPPFGISQDDANDDDDMDDDQDMGDEDFEDDDDSDEEDDEEGDDFGTDDEDEEGDEDEDEENPFGDEMGNDEDEEEVPDEEEEEEPHRFNFGSGKPDFGRPRFGR